MRWFIVCVLLLALVGCSGTPGIQGAITTSTALDGYKVRVWSGTEVVKTYSVHGKVIFADRTQQASFKDASGSWVVIQGPCVFSKE